MSDVSLSGKWQFPSQYCGIREKLVGEGRMVKRRATLLSYLGRLLSRAAIHHGIGLRSRTEQEIFRGQSITEKKIHTRHSDNGP